MTQGVALEVEIGRVGMIGRDGAPPAGMSLFEVDAMAPSGAERIMARSQEVMSRVLACLQGSDGGEISLEAAHACLPRWFVDASGAEQSPEEARAWLKHLASLSPAERAEAELAHKWSVSDFMYWFEPGQREWWWWGSEVMDPDTVRVYLAVREPSFPHEALDWMLRASGAVEVVDENVRDLSQNSSADS